MGRMKLDLDSTKKIPSQIDIDSSVNYYGPQGSMVGNKNIAVKVTLSLQLTDDEIDPTQCYEYKFVNRITDKYKGVETELRSKIEELLQHGEYIKKCDKSDLPISKIIDRLTSIYMSCNDTVGREVRFSLKRHDDGSVFDSPNVPVPQPFEAVTFNKKDLKKLIQDIFRTANCEELLK